MRTRFAILLLTTALAACNGGGSGTYVHLSLQATGSPVGVNEVDLKLMLAGRSANATVGKGSLTFPSDVTLDIVAGEGPMQIDGTVTDTVGTPLAIASTMTTIVRGQTAQATLSFGFGDAADLSELGPPPDLFDVPDMAHTPALLSLDMPSYDFGTIIAGQLSAPLTITVTNIGELPTGPLPPVTLSGVSAQSGIAVSADNCNTLSLIASQSCTIQLTASPGVSLTGAISAMVSLTGTPGGMVSANITGTVVAPSMITITPPLIFGTVNRGTVPAPTITVTVTNTGGANTATLTAATLANNSPANFNITADGCTGKSLTPSGASRTCTITISFTPQSYGSKAAMLNINAGAALLGQATASGTGQETFTLTVTNPGGGTLTTSPPSAINCPGTCVASYAVTGTPPPPAVTVVATPTAGLGLKAFNGDCLGLGCSVVMSQARSVGVTFNATLTVTITTMGANTGNVTSVVNSVAGPTCNAPASPCNFTFDYGSALQLTANPMPPATSQFLGWSGNCSGTGLCSLPATNPVAVTASFGTGCPGPSTTVFVDNLLGVDDFSHGTGAGRCAVRTIKFAVDNFPSALIIQLGASQTYNSSNTTFPITLGGRALNCAASTIQGGTSNPVINLLNGGDSVGNCYVDCNNFGDAIDISAPTNTSVGSNTIKRCNQGIVVMNGAQGVQINSNQFQSISNVAIIFNGNNGSSMLGFNSFDFTPPLAIQCIGAGTGQIMGNANNQGGAAPTCQGCGQCPFYP